VEQYNPPIYLLREFLIYLHYCFNGVKILQTPSLDPEKTSFLSIKNPPVNIY